MKYYWINVDSSTERREFMEKQFKDLGLENDNIRISATTPQNIDLKKSVIKKDDSLNSDEEFCCSISHLNVFIKALEDNENTDEYFFVLEDDMYIPKIDDSKILNIINMSEKYNNKKIDIIQLYTNSAPFIYKLYNDFVSNKNKLFTERIYPDNYPSTGFYIISKEGAKKLIERFVKKEDNNIIYDFSKDYLSAADYIIYNNIVSYIVSFPITKSNTKFMTSIHIKDENSIENSKISNINANTLIDCIIKNHNNINIFQ